MSQLDPSHIYPFAGLCRQSYLDDWTEELTRILPGRASNQIECQDVFQRITEFATDKGKITLLPGTFHQERGGGRGETVFTRMHIRQEMEISPSTEDESLLGLLADMQEMGFAKKFFRVRIYVEMLWEPNFSSVQYMQTGTELTFELQCKIRVSSLDVSPPSCEFTPSPVYLSSTGHSFQVEKYAEIVRGRWKYHEMQDRNQELSFCHAACYNFSSAVLTQLEETIKYVLFLHLKG